MDAWAGAAWLRVCVILALTVPLALGTRTNEAGAAGDEGSDTARSLPAPVRPVGVAGSTVIIDGQAYPYWPIVDGEFVGPWYWYDEYGPGRDSQYTWSRTTRGKLVRGARRPEGMVREVLAGNYPGGGYDPLRGCWYEPDPGRGFAQIILGPPDEPEAICYVNQGVSTVLADAFYVSIASAMLSAGASAPPR